MKLKYILIAVLAFIMVLWIKPLYEFLHEKAVDLGLGTGDKVALYVDGDVLANTFKKREALNISEDSPGNAYRGPIIKVYPIYLRYKKSGVYFISYPTKDRDTPNIKTHIDANKIRKVDYYFRDEVQFSLAGALGGD